MKRWLLFASGTAIVPAGTVAGKRPDGTPIEVTPLESLRQMSDTEVTALFLYLEGLAGA